MFRFPYKGERPLFSVPLQLLHVFATARQSRSAICAPSGTRTAFGSPDPAQPRQTQCTARIGLQAIAGLLRG